MVRNLFLDAESQIVRAGPRAVISGNDQQGVLPLADRLQSVHQTTELVILVSQVLGVAALLERKELDPTDPGLLEALAVQTMTFYFIDSFVPVSVVLMQHG